MPVKTQEALSPSHQDILQLIPQYEIKPIFLREHLRRELVIGTIGDRGGGKSGSDAVIGLVDFMLTGKPAWSNMKISCDIEIDDETAQKYGLNYGGVAHYESKPLEKSALLKLDETYMDGLLLIEEINIQFANARSALTNTNKDFNEVCQQLRKFRTSLVYNVIDEMFIDVQLRGLTDVFLNTYDTAFDLDSLESKKQTGLDFKWTIYPMTGYLAGEQGKYSVTKKPMPPVYFHFGSWRGIYNTEQWQEKGTYSMSRKDREKAMQADISVESSQDIINSLNELQWAIDFAQELKADGVTQISKHEIGYRLGMLVDKSIIDVLGIVGIHWNHKAQTYLVDNYDLTRLGKGKSPRPLALV